MSRRISDRLLMLLSEFATRWLGLHFPRKRWGDLARIICHVAQELEVGDVDAFIGRIVSGQITKEQEEVLAEQLTIGETYFFREQKGFDILESRILPELIASRRGREQRLRIWSAGCSSGEEPYSLAIMLNRLIPDFWEWQITILATDINSRALGKAVHGVYGDWSFRGVPSWVRQRYFTKTPEGRDELQHGIRRMVTFSVLNLAEDTYPSLSTNTNAMDVILCRNVLMYFEPKQRQRVVRNLQRSLLEGGWLVVSPCETSPIFSTSFETVMFPEAVFYRKNGSGKKPHIMVPPAPAVAADAPFRPPRVPAAVPESFWVPAPAGVKAVVSEAYSPTYEMALARYQSGSYQEATDMLSGLFARIGPETYATPAFGKAAALMAQVQANRGEIALALEWVEKAIVTDKLNAELYYLRATILQEQGDIPGAMASLKQAIYLDQAFAMAHFTLGTLALQSGRPEEAGKHLENALSLLNACPADDPVPGGDGMTAARLSEIISATRASISHR